MKYFYIITNETKDPDFKVTNYIRNYLEERGKICTTDLKLVECALVLGGDGTLLRATTDLAHLNIPFLGINLGGLGFLAEVDRTEIDRALDRLIADEFQIEKRMMLSGMINDRKDSEGHNRALNDVVIIGKTPVQMMYFNLYVNGLLLKRFVADGVIVSTPTGSTGYNLSAGGPIVEPKAELVLITPLNPHSLHSRSIVLAAEDEVTVEIDVDKYGKDQQAEAIFDGSCRVSLVTGDKVTITRSEKATEILKLSTTNFLEILHKKMID